MAKEPVHATNKLEWAVSQSHGTCQYCNMDLSVLLPVPSPQVAGRGSNERRASRLFGSDSNENSDGIGSSRNSCGDGAIGGKLEPFRLRDTDRGVYTDENDPLGRVWYHIPNLGPKFCDAVRKYSIVADYREAHVIARKKSKDSECMWVGIVGDPAAYTTGSKRHIIELMLKNPDQNFDQVTRRVQSRVRIRNISGIKRRKRRKRRTPPSRSVKQSEDNTSCGVNSERENLHSDQDSSHISSGSLSILSKENIDIDGPAFGFSFRERSPLTTPGNHADSGQLKRCGLPPTSSTGSLLTVNTDDSCQRDWLDAIYKDPVLYALREPPLPSPDSGNFFYISKFETYLSHNAVGRQPPSVTMNGPGFAIRKYSVADLNELLLAASD